MAGWFLVAFAPFVGSFLGVIIRRLPTQQSVAWCRSQCEACRHPIAAYDLIPIVSYLLLHRSCRHCGQRIRPFHIQIELSAIAIAASVVMIGGSPPFLIASCMLGWTLLALAWIDCEHLVLPDILTLPLILGGLAMAWLYQPTLLAAHAAAAVAGYLAFVGIAAAYRVVRHRDGLGAGDAKLFAAAGAWVGWQLLPTVALGAALAGIGLVIAQRAAGRSIGMATAIPFGPCLALAIWAAWLWSLGVMPQEFRLLS